MACDFAPVACRNRTTDPERAVAAAQPAGPEFELALRTRCTRSEPARVMAAVSLAIIFASGRSLRYARTRRHLDEEVPMPAPSTRNALGGSLLIMSALV